MHRAAGAALLPLAWGMSASLAEDLGPRGRLIDLATIEITSDLCTLDLSDAQTDAIAVLRNRLIDDGAVTARDVADIHDQLAVTMAAEVPEGLCKPDGAGIRFYNQKLAELGVQ